MKTISVSELIPFKEQFSKSGVGTLIPLKTNYFIESSFSLFGINREILEVTIDFHDSTTTLNEHLTVEYLQPNIHYMIFTDEQYKFIENIISKGNVVSNFS